MSNYNLRSSHRLGEEEPLSSGDVLPRATLDAARLGVASSGSHEGQARRPSLGRGRGRGIFNNNTY